MGNFYNNYEEEQYRMQLKKMTADTDKTAYEKKRDEVVKEIAGTAKPQYTPDWYRDMT